MVGNVLLPRGCRQVMITGGETVEYYGSGEDLKDELRRAVRACGGMSAFARNKHVSAALVSRTLSGDIRVDDTIAQALGYFSRQIFVKAKGNT